MNTDDISHLIGLRFDDLSPEEHGRRAALLQRSPDARRDHDFALALGQSVRALPVPEPRALPRPRSTRPRAAIGVGLALAATALLMVVPDTPTTRDKGLGAPEAAPPAFLQAAAEQPNGSLRPLADGARVATDEWVVFQARGTPHHAWLLEDGRPLPLSAHQLSSHTPTAFRPDGAPTGARRYTLVVCPPGQTPGGPACTEDALVLVWD